MSVLTVGAVPNLKRFLIIVSRVLGINTMAMLYSTANPEKTANMINQNHRKM